MRGDYGSAEYCDDFNHRKEQVGRSKAVNQKQF